jgi:hypothetical protein
LQLSGGMKKRAAFARAMALDPETLFFDEPSAGLDPITAAGIDDLILSLKKAYALSMVVVTHELASVFLIADRMILIDRGDIAAMRPVEEVKNGRHPRVRQFLDRIADTNQDDAVDHLRMFTEGLSEVSMNAWGLRLRRARDALAKYRAPQCCLPVSLTPSAPVILAISELTISGYPACMCPCPTLQVRGCPPPSPGSGSGWFATPFPYDSFIHYFTPVYPDTIQAEGLRHGLPGGHGDRVTLVLRRHLRS